MGKVSKVFYEKLISDIPDRNTNRLKVQQAPNGEVTIHFRNIKIVLHDFDEIMEWQQGFSEALDKFEKGNFFKQDI